MNTRVPIEIISMNATSFFNWSLIRKFAIRWKKDVFPNSIGNTKNLNIFIEFSFDRYIHLFQKGFYSSYRFILRLHSIAFLHSSFYNSFFTFTISFFYGDIHNLSWLKSRTSSNRRFSRKAVLLYIPVKRITWQICAVRTWDRALEIFANFCDDCHVMNRIRFST